MGQIANQMALEWCHKIAQRMGEKRDQKKRADQDKKRLSKEADCSSLKKETE